MSENIRTYSNLKLFRGKKRNNAEMERLADTRQDFEYRRLLIEENELDLHIFFSRITVFNWLSWSFLALAFSYFQFQIISYAFLILAAISRMRSYRNKKMFQFVFRSQKIALSIVDCVIKQDYGISLK
jgi:hypothetical protein